MTNMGCGLILITCALITVDAHEVDSAGFLPHLQTATSHNHTSNALRIHGYATAGAHEKPEHGQHGDKYAKSQARLGNEMTDAGLATAEDVEIPRFPSPLTAEVLLNSEAAKAVQEYYLHSHGALKRAKEVVKHSLHAEANAAFFLQAGLLLLAFFVAIYAYSTNHALIEEKTGLKLTHVCCITYASLSISIDLSIKNAAVQYGGHFPFNPACGVVVVEYSKLAVSVVLFGYTASEARRQGREVLMPTRNDVAWLSIPAVIYAINNLLVFQAIKSTPLSTFGVVRETMLIWNAIIWTFVFQQSISVTRWLAITGIFLGCSVNQIPKMLNDEWTAGVFWAFMLAFSNAAGAVANEYAMKKRAALDINLQNCILYAQCGTFVLAGIATLDTKYVRSASNFFTGFVPECWQVIILQVFTGLAVSRILKYVEAVTKTIVAAVRGPGVIFFGAILFHTSLGISEVLATLVVCVSCWVYLREGPISIQAKNEHPKESPKETDKLMDKAKMLYASDGSAASKA